MLTVQHLYKSFGAHPVLADVSFSIQSHERTALIGPNGCGKTTLLRILAGEEQPDSGTILTNGSRIQCAYLPQEFYCATNTTISSYLENTGMPLNQINERLTTLASQLVTQPQNEEIQAAYDQMLSAIEISFWQQDQRAALLAAFGLERFDPETPVTHLSGGQKTRLALVRLLLSRSDVLLLDEPTNHLDLEMLSWLETWLLNYQGAVLVTSHDRAFLDRIPTTVLALDPVSHQVHAYPGRYSDYCRSKASEKERQMQEYLARKEEIRQLKTEAAHMRELSRFKKGGKADTNDKLAKGFFANRSAAVAQKARRVDQTIEMLENDDSLRKPTAAWKMKMELFDSPESSRNVLICEDLSIGYGERPVLEHIEISLHYQSRCALIGPNGSGKSTLLKTFAGLRPPLGGLFYFGSSIQPGYLAQGQEDLPPEVSPYLLIQSRTNLNETDTRAFLHKYLFTPENVFLPIRSLSPGERTRLSLAAFIAQGKNLLLLDEPFNHLDIDSREQFEQAISQFKGTVLIAVHDRYFIERYATELWEIQDGRILLR